MEEEDAENDPEEEKLEQSSNNFQTASKRVNVAEQLKVCDVYFHIILKLMYS